MNERFALNTTLAACLLMVCALLHENARNVLADASLLVAYAFDEGSGSTTADASGSNNTADLINSPTWTAGHSGSALNFSGINDYVISGNVGSMNGLTAVTVSAWVRGSVAPASPDAVILGKDQAFALAVGIDSPHKAQFAIKSGSTWFGFPASVTNVDDGNFHFLTAVYDGNTLLVYVDGNQEGAQVIGRVTLNANSTDFEIASCAGGPDCDPSGEHWRGIIDDVRVYNRALSLAEIQADMATPVSGSLPP